MALEVPGSLCQGGHPPSAGHSPVRPARLLQTFGYRVLEASQWTEAIRLCEQHQSPIHLLLTDMVMPEMGGRQLAERLTNLRPDLNVLYLSGYTDDTVIHHGVLQAAVAFLQKPFTPFALATKVREVLDQQK